MTEESQEFSYRKYEPADKEVVTDLIKTLYQEYPSGENITDEKINATLKEFSSHPSKGSILVIEADGQVIGYQIVIFYWSNEYGGNILCLDEICIKPEYRGRGIGTKFIQALVDKRYGNCVAVQSVVTPDNKKSQEWHSKLGFEPYGNHTLILTFD